MDAAGQWRCGGEVLGDFDDGGVPVIAGLREDVVEMRNGETRTMGRTARSRASRGDVGKWPEVHRAPARVRVDGAVDLLREKGKEGHR